MMIDYDDGLGPKARTLSPVDVAALETEAKRVLDLAARLRGLPNRDLPRDREQAAALGAQVREVHSGANAIRDITAALLKALHSIPHD